MIVTVVATGLGGMQIEKPTKVVDNTVRNPRTADFHNLDKPAVLRKKEAARINPGSEEPRAERQPMQKAVGADSDMDFLDIPAFLRKQAD